MRVKGGVKARRKHNRILRANKGYRMSKRRLIQSAKEAELHAGAYAFAGRKNKKRDMKHLWLTRISEAVKKQDISYSKFKHGLKLAKIDLNSKILANFAVNDQKVFEQIVGEAKKALHA